MRTSGSSGAPSTTCSSRRADARAARASRTSGSTASVPSRPTWRCSAPPARRTARAGGGRSPCSSSRSSKCSKPAVRNPTDVLLALIEAYRAVHDETASSATLARYLVAGRGNAAGRRRHVGGGPVPPAAALADRAEAYYDRALGAVEGPQGGASSGAGTRSSSSGTTKARSSCTARRRTAAGGPRAPSARARPCSRLGDLRRGRPPPTRRCPRRPSTCVRCS